MYVSGKYPLLVDPTGQASQFLKYRARLLSVFQKGDFEKESLRKGLTQTMHNGAWLVLDFGNLDCDLESHFEKDNFPDSVLSPHELFLEETFRPLLRPTDEFTAKVTYEHQEAMAVGAFQDRTKAHAPERVADIDKKFDPKDAFRLIVCTKKEEVPPELAAKMCVLNLQVSEEQVKENAGVWAGREKPKDSKSKEQIKLDTELLELAFDGEADEVKKLLEKGADPMAKDGRGHMALSEAAVQGHLETVRCLLDWRTPIGSDPNQGGSDGRTALHRAAFQGHLEVVQLLLERGGDPRLKDRQGERSFDLASSEECRAALEKWDIAVTDKLKEERQAALDVEDEKNVRNEEERLALERMKLTKRLIELVEAGDKEGLESELSDIEDPRQIGTYRDDRGNNVLHMACQHGKLEIVTMLIDTYSIPVNTREAKGWTPIAIAAFKGHKKVCQALLDRQGDPSIPNAYRRDAYQVAQDDEIRDTLQAGPTRASASGAADDADDAADAADAGEDEDDGEGGAAAKAKAKSKAKGKAKAKAGASEAPAGSGAAAAKALAKGKAKAKAKSRR